MNVEIIKGLVSITTIICICFTVIFCFKYYLEYHNSHNYDELYDIIAELKEEIAIQRSHLIYIKEGVKDLERKD